MTEKQEEAIIRKVARQVRRRVLKANNGSSECMCCEASHWLKDTLKELGVHVKVIEGLFKVDDHRINADGHYWCEWKHTPIDVTADQFNLYQHPGNEIPAIVFGTWLDRYLGWNDDDSDVKYHHYI